MTAVALTIAGSDPSGGAGLQADLKTFHQHGVYGMSAVTLLTVQNTREVRSVQIIAPDFVGAQIDAVLEDIRPHAGKTGALGSTEVIEVVAERAATCAFPLVVDPVMISKHGAPLLSEDARDALKSKLLPHAFLITPNLHEAAALLGWEPGSLATVEAMSHAAMELARLGPRHVVITGGVVKHEAVDVLLADGDLHRLAAPRIETKHTHGSGCAFSAAITAHLAQGIDLVTAVNRAKAFITAAIRAAPGLGRGYGPTDLGAST